jgi:hypothetical protein
MFSLTQSIWSAVWSAATQPVALLGLVAGVRVEIAFKIR